MVKTSHNTAGLVFILIGFILLTLFPYWQTVYPFYPFYPWLQYILGNSNLVLGGALLGFGLREILLGIDTNQTKTVEEHL